jgi:hypothetical protein
MAAARSGGGGNGVDAQLVRDPGKKFSVLVHEQWFYLIQAENLKPNGQKESKDLADSMNTPR